MRPSEPSGPDLAGVVADAEAAGLPHVVIGGFSVIVHGYVRAIPIDWSGQTIRFASLPSVVGFKRLARRPQDAVDLSELEAIHGELPIEPIPGVDS